MYKRMYTITIISMYYEYTTCFSDGRIAYEMRNQTCNLSYPYHPIHVVPVERNVIKALNVIHQAMRPLNVKGIFLQ